MDVFDIFRDDAFGLIALTDAINNVPYKPSKIGAMGLFEDKPVHVNTVMIEEKDHIISLIPNTTRGEPPKIGSTGKRRTRIFQIPHLPLDDAVKSVEVQGVRKFGSTNEMESAQEVVNAKIFEMRQTHEATLEYHRLGCLNGCILDDDGETVILNLFDEFDVHREVVDFNFGVGTTDIRAVCIALARAMEANLGAVPFQYIHVMCGKTWFDTLIAHAEVKSAYERFNAGQFLRADVRTGFPLGRCFFEDYGGHKIGTINFIKDDDAIAFPVGIPGLFKTYWGPPDFWGASNTLGKPYYARQELLAGAKGVMINTESNPLNLCLKPRVLVQCTKS